MGVLIGNPKKAPVYPLGRGLEVAKRKKKEDSYMIYLSKQILENYGTFIKAAER